MYGYGKVTKSFFLSGSGSASKILASSHAFCHFSSILFRMSMKVSELGCGLLKVLLVFDEEAIPQFLHHKYIGELPLMCYSFGERFICFRMVFSAVSNAFLRFLIFVPPP